LRRQNRTTYRNHEIRASRRIIEIKLLSEYWNIFTVHTGVTHLHWETVVSSTHSGPIGLIFPTFFVFVEQTLWHIILICGWLLGNSDGGASRFSRKKNLISSETPPPPPAGGMVKLELQRKPSQKLDILAPSNLPVSVAAQYSAMQITKSCSVPIVQNFVRPAQGRPIQHR
jgi:hypothetical protein